MYHLYRFARIILIINLVCFFEQMFLDPADNDKRHTTNDQTAGFDVSVLITEVRYIITILLLLLLLIMCLLDALLTLLLCLLLF